MRDTKIRKKLAISEKWPAGWIFGHDLFQLAFRAAIQEGEHPPPLGVKNFPG